MMINRFSLLNVILLFLLFSCSEKIDNSLEDIEEIIITNNRYKYNCGLKKIRIVNKEKIEFIYKELKKTKKASLLTTVNNNNGVVRFNLGLKDNSKKKLLYGKIRLVLTVNYGNIYIMNNGGYYKNDYLTKYILSVLKVENEKISSSIECLDSRGSVVD